MKALILGAVILSSIALPASAGHVSRPTIKQALQERMNRSERKERPATVPARDGWNLEVVDALETGFPQGACIIGNYAYIGFNGVISIFDITNPSSPVRAGFALTSQQVIDFCARGNYLYCANYPE